MSRVLLAAGVVLAVLAALAATVAALADGPDVRRDGEIALAGLSGPVALAWADGGVAVEAATWPDAAAGLGYAHTADHAAALVLWRQAARGETAAWFGDSARTADLHARRLGFDALARQTYDGLDAPTRALLDAYARGVNAALATPGVAQSDAFVWLDVAPEPWQPWDALAVERLVAYLATPEPAADPAFAVARDAPAVARFLRDDAAFRRALGVSGAAFARAFTAPTPAGRALVAHQPGGTSALPLLVPVAFRVGTPRAGVRHVAVASVPGTLSLPAGTDGAAAWAVMLTSALRLDAFAGTPPAPVYSRVVDRDGGETLVAVARDSSGLVLGPRAAPAAPPAGPPAGPARADSARPGPASPRRAGPPPARAPAVPRPADARPPTATPAAARPSTALPAAVRPATATPADSAAAPTRWVVRWPGFALGTDATAFAALADGRAPGPFRLLRGDGLLATATRTRVLGRPDVAGAAGGTALVAGDRTARWAAARLAVLAARRTSTAALAADARSEWAARRLPPLLRALGPRDATPRALDDAAAFLRSWDGAYAPDAIAPSIFEAWLAAHRAFTGHLPDPADSADVALLPFTLAIARGELADAHGRDPAGWRWGALRGGTFTPVLGRLGGAAGRRYAPAPAGPGGHPTALRPGPALVPDDAPPADSAAADAAAADTAGAPRPARLVVSPGPAVWSVWTTLGAARLFVRGPGRADATVSPLDAALGDPGVTVGVDARAPLSARRLLLTPPSARR